ncbi:hypothetical protein HNR03_006219 [Pseudomonas sp. JAI111]|uniref:hypothetical protein n=1 Tax=Pseudomonas sp. JAI111 TaxID=2735913 RepID=UPI002168677F|nr:hypothetical protein [Pseudomonas sp. JAI111]MCS3841582.1 hypothetical protein [Pseudomonas sp. JAI111]
MKRTSATIRKYKSHVVKAVERLHAYNFKIWITVGIITSALALLACKPSEHKNSAEITGTQQNICMDDALAATKNKYNMSYDQLVSRDKSARHSFVGAVEFKSLITEGLALENIYPDNTLRDGSKVARPGIMVAVRVPMRNIKENYPDVILSELSHQPTSLVVILTCRPDLKFSPRAALTASNIYPISNRELGVYESRKNGEVISIPIDDKTRYPDGTIVSVNCEEKLTKICDSSFVIVPGVFVQYRYPIEQRADWERIKDFVVSELNASMTDR